jgi:hypothetical protein
MGIVGDGNALYVFGRVQAASLIPPDGFLTKYDVNGNQLWTTKFTPPAGPSALPGVREVRGSADSSGVYLAETTGDGRGIVMRYDSDGGRDWSLQLPWTTGLASSPSPGDAITTQQTSVYVGGDLSNNVPISTGFSNTAFISAISKSSSLVFFGVNPPFSFGLLGLLITAAVVSIVWFRKRLKSKIRPASAVSSHRLKKIPTDLII